MYGLLLLVTVVISCLMLAPGIQDWLTKVRIGTLLNLVTLCTSYNFFIQGAILPRVDFSHIQTFGHNSGG